MPETASGAGLIPAVHILVLAAGASSRMNGQDKLLMSIGKMPLLRAVATVAVATGASVLVALPPDSAARQAAIAGLAVQIVTVAGAIQDLSRTIARGVAAISAFGAEDGLMILPGDMPDFDPAALSDLVTRFQADPGQIIRGGTASGQPGHPVIFPRDLWPELATLTGDAGGRPLLHRNQARITVVPLPGQMATCDLDTPADWAVWRNRNS